MFDTNQQSYQDFRSIVKERTDPVVAWVGAGLSRPAQLPGWSELRDSLVSAATSTLATLDIKERTKRSNQIKAAVQQRNLWSAFEILKKTLGPTSYKSAVRRAIHSDDVSVPSGYRDLWSLGLRGIVTLNLDGLTQRAFAEVYGGQTVNIFNGQAASKHIHLLRGRTPFVANLHGVISDVSSWVLTRPEFRSLISDPGYLEFVRSVLAQFTNLFVGLTVDDVSIEGHLTMLKEAGVDLGAHFWLTDRADASTDRWAESVGVRLIRYSPANHHQELNEFFSDLRQYVPFDVEAAPLPPPVPPSDAALPPVDELLRVDKERMRTALNAKAAAILSRGGQPALDEYADFRREYDEAIHSAWYVTTLPPRNTLMEFTLLEEIASGAFGTVYKAFDEVGEPVAIKLLRPEIRTNPGMLESFRRGVRSMQILSDRKVAGMVPYKRAAEIPAFVVMELIDGPNLQKAVSQRMIRGWQEVLRIGVDLAGIIRRAHGLPERVLHRDIRPTNVMLAGFYESPLTARVLVLDFDLSWHRDAIEKTMMQGQHVSGYLAPEQYQRDSPASTRSALVDSYGLGMTLYFLATGFEPIVAQHRHTEWLTVLKEQILNVPSARWQSIPIRFARLVENATRDDQAARWDMAAIHSELQRLLECARDGRAPASMELLAEELICRTSYRDRYEWSTERVAAQLDSPSGVHLTLEGLEVDFAIRVEFSWQERERQKSGGLSRWMTDALTKASAVLRRCGWTVDSRKNVDGHEFYVWATVNGDQCYKNLDRYAKSLEEAITAMQRH